MVVSIFPSGKKGKVTIRLTHRPSQDVWNGRENTSRRKVHREVPHTHSLHSGQQYVPDPTKTRRKDDHQSPLLRAVRNIREDHSEQERNEIWRRGQSLRVDCTVSHILEDGRQEER